MGGRMIASGGSESADVAILDLTAPTWREGFASLTATGTANPVGIVGVVASLADSADSTGAPFPVEDFVTLANLEAELPLRLDQAAQRRMTQADADQRQQDLSLLLDLTSRYAESLDVEELLPDVTRRLAQRLGIKRVSLVVLDDKNDAGYVLASSDDAQLKGLRIELARYPEIREVVRTGKPVIVEDAPTHPLLEGFKTQVAASGIRAIAAVPLSVRNKVLGVLLVRAAVERPAFSPREIDFLSTVAHATAVALRNAKLLESFRGDTEREKKARMAAEARAADLRRYEAYFAHVSEGIAILDEQGQVLSLNPSAIEMFETDGEEARGQSVNALVRPVDSGMMMDVLLSVSVGEVRRDVDLPAYTAKGNPLILSLCAAPLGDSSGTAIVSFRDVTHVRQTADELKQTKDFLERLIDSSVDAIIAADMTGQVLLFSKGAETILGYRSSEALSRLNVRDIYPPGTARRIMAKLRSSDGAGPGRLSMCREELITRTGERIPVNLTASIVYEQGRETATVGIFSDLRGLMQLEQKLSDAQSRLEESERNAVIVALAGTAAHELNQPLTSVMGYAELLRRKLKEEDPSYRAVDIIYREAERMAELVRRIGKITRYETKSYVGKSEIIDLDKASSDEK